MPFNFNKDDLRRRKTKEALDVALLMLLEQKNFRKITVSDICEEALVSRAAFYAHYTDKYNLLARCMEGVRPQIITELHPYEQLAARINEYVTKNERIIKNVIHDADDETMALVFDFMLTLLDISLEKEREGKICVKYVVSSSFFAGGLIQYISWHINNKYPFEVMNEYLYDFISKMRKWESE